MPELQNEAVETDESGYTPIARIFVHALQQQHHRDLNEARALWFAETLAKTEGAADATPALEFIFAVHSAVAERAAKPTVPAHFDPWAVTWTILAKPDEPSSRFIWATIAKTVMSRTPRRRAHLGGKPPSDLTAAARSALEDD